MHLITLLAIGLVAGVLSGIFGIGGGVLIVPALMYLLGYSQKMAIGTSLAILLPPVGIAAVFEYYTAGDVDVRAAIAIAIMLILGGWLGAKTANQINVQTLKLAFGVFMMGLGGYIVFDAVKA
jgi:uncharacterized membrane protein YfcA